MVTSAINFQQSAHTDETEALCLAFAHIIIYARARLGQFYSLGDARRGQELYYQANLTGPGRRGLGINAACFILNLLV